MFIHIYIHIQRERCTYTHTYIYIHIYIYVYMYVIIDTISRIYLYTRISGTDKHKRYIQPAQATRQVHVPCLNQFQESFETTHWLPDSMISKYMYLCVYIYIYAHQMMHVLISRLYPHIDVDPQPPYSIAPKSK